MLFICGDIQYEHVGSPQKPLVEGEFNSYSPLIFLLHVGFGGCNSNPRCYNQAEASKVSKQSIFAGTV